MEIINENLKQKQREDIKKVEAKLKENNFEEKKRNMSDLIYSILLKESKEEIDD